MLWRCEYIPLKIALHHHNRNNSAITVKQMFDMFVIISESPKTRPVTISIRTISMHKIESREISNLSKTILACRERQAKTKNVKILVHNSVILQWDIQLTCISQNSKHCCLWQHNLQLSSYHTGLIPPKIPKTTSRSMFCVIIPQLEMFYLFAM